MATNIYYETDRAKVYFDEDLNTLFLVYKNRVGGTERFIEINEAMLKAFRNLDTQVMVVDARHMGVISIDSQNYVKDTLLPAMQKHLDGKTFYHAQLINPSDIFSKIAANKIKNGAEENIQENFVMKQFTEMEDIHSWIRSLTKKPVISILD